MATEGGERSMPQPSALITAVTADDEITALFKAHGDTVARWACRLGGPGIDEEDIVQEVFLVARRRLGGYEGDAKVTTWLFRITERVAKVARRKAHRHGRWALLPAIVAHGLVAPQRGPGEQLDRSEVSRLVYAILDRLPENQRKVLILFQLEEMSTEQIAELVDAKAATVRVWLHRARLRFAELYRQIEERDDSTLHAGEGRP